MRVHLTNGKAPGRDGIAPEFIKYAGGTDVDENGNPVFCSIDFALCDVFNACIEHGEIPEYWISGKVVLLFKGGYPYNSGDWRGITLMSTLGKMFTKLLADKIMEFVEKYHLLSRGQNGSEDSDHAHNMYLT